MGRDIRLRSGNLVVYRNKLLLGYSPSSTGQGRHFVVFNTSIRRVSSYSMYLISGDSECARDSQIGNEVLRNGGCILPRTGRGAERVLGDEYRRPLCNCWGSDGHWNQVSFRCTFFLHWV